MKPNPADELGRRQVGDSGVVACPTCGLTVSRGLARCPQDGTRLIEEPLGAFAQQYEFLEALGTGGMSVIYKARHRALNKIVAIKMLHEHMLDDKHVRRFQQEGKAASTLDHPNIVKVFDFGLTDKGQPYMVMDVAEGKSLAQVLKELGELPLSQCLIIFIDICDALIHAHSKGILHRDLKPSNIMLTTAFDRPMQAKLVDFGIAKLMTAGNDSTLQQLTQSGDIFGSPLYMSPEQCQGKTLDVRADMYSFACLMFESLVGHVPFQGDSVVETLSLQVQNPPPLLRDCRPEKKYPRRLEDLIDKCLAKNPDSRFRTMDEVRSILIAIQTELDAGALKDKQSLHGFLRSAAQWKLVIALLIVVIAALAALAMLATLNRTFHKEKQAELHHDIVADQSKFLPLINHAHIDDELIGRCLEVKTLLRELSLRDSKITDKSLPFINLQTDLEMLALDNCRVTDNGLKKLTDLHNILSLSLKGTKVTSEGLRALGYMPKIQMLDLDYCKVDDQGIRYVTNLKDINVLTLVHCPVSGQSLKYLQSLPFLRSLNLGSIAFSEQDLSILRHYNLLGRLVIRKCGVSDAALKNLPANLELLDISANDAVTDAGIPAITQMPHLKSLDISYTKVSNVGLRELALCPHLEELRLNGHHIDSETIEILKSFKHLTSLSVAYCNDIDDDMVAEIAKLKNVTALVLSNNYNITFKTASIIGNKMPQLVRLGIENTHILNEDSVIELAKLKNLRELFLKGCDVDGPDYVEVHYLRKYLKGCEVKAS